MKNKSNIFKDITFTINPKKYVVLRKRKLFNAFLNIAIVALVIGLIQGVVSFGLITTAEDVFVEAMKQEESEFELKDGILNFKKETFKEEEGQILLLVDTNKTISQIDSLKNITVHKEVVTALLKNGIMVKNGGQEVTMTYEELGLAATTINNNSVLKFIEDFSYFKFLLIPIGIIAQYIVLLVYALLVSIIGLFANMINKTKLNYKDIFKLSLYSITIPYILSAFLPLGGFVVLFSGFILTFGTSYITMSEMV